MHTFIRFLSAERMAKIVKENGKNEKKNIRKEHTKSVYSTVAICPMRAIF